MRICVGVVHLLSDEVKYLGSTFCVYVHLNQTDKRRDLRTLISWGDISASSVNISKEEGLQCQIALTRSAHLHSSAFQSSPNACKCNMLGSVTDQRRIYLLKIQPRTTAKTHRSNVAFSWDRSLSITGWMPSIRNSYRRWTRNSRLVCNTT